MVRGQVHLYGTCEIYWHKMIIHLSVVLEANMQLEGKSRGDNGIGHTEEAYN